MARRACRRPERRAPSWLPTAWTRRCTTQIRVRAKICEYEICGRCGQCPEPGRTMKARGGSSAHALARMYTFTCTYTSLPPKPAHALPFHHRYRRCLYCCGIGPETSLPTGGTTQRRVRGRVSSIAAARAPPRQLSVTGSCACTTRILTCLAQALGCLAFHTHTYPQVLVYVCVSRSLSLPPQT
jgi:hypothetical protein